MDNKQTDLIEQYYASPSVSTVYCKECGCAVDIASDEMSYTIDNKRSRLKPIIIILLTAIAILSAALLICAHIISDLKKPSSTGAEYICKSVNEINTSKYYKF